MSKHLLPELTRLRKAVEAGISYGFSQGIWAQCIARIEQLEAAQRPDAEAIAAVPQLANKKALVLYFETDADRDEVAAALQEAYPGMRAVNV